jgi:hypothetical protein
MTFQTIPLRAEGVLRVPAQPGVFVINKRNGGVTVGKTLNLRARLTEALLNGAAARASYLALRRAEPRELLLRRLARGLRGR